MKKYKERRLSDFKAWYNPDSNFFIQFNHNLIHDDFAKEKRLGYSTDDALRKGYIRISLYNNVLSIEISKMPNDREFLSLQNIIKDNSYWNKIKKTIIDIHGHKTYKFEGISFLIADNFKDLKEEKMERYKRIYTEEIVSTDIPQKLRPEKIIKNKYNFPNDDWNKSVEKHDLYKYMKKKKKEDSVAFQTPVIVSNY